MADQICECGHLKSDHQEMMLTKPDKKDDKAYLKWVAKGRGMCVKCTCTEFKNKPL